MKLPPYPRVARSLIDLLRGYGLDAFLVGGAVRGFLTCGQWGEDLDFEVHGPAQPGLAARLLAQGVLRFAQGEGIPLESLAFEVYRLRAGKLSLELALAREEKYLAAAPGHSSFTPHYIPYYQFARSFRRRDFTLNAIAYDHREQRWIDPLGGRKDLERKQLTPCSEDFIWDPVRYLRAMRFSLSQHLDFAPRLQAYLPQMQLHSLSWHYFFSELFKASDQPGFCRLCLQWSCSLPPDMVALLEIVGSSKVRVWHDLHHLCYEYFCQGGELAVASRIFADYKQWRLVFFSQLVSATYSQWRELLGLDFEQFEQNSLSQNYLWLFQCFVRHRPGDVFLTAGHGRLLQDFSLMIAMSSPSCQHIAPSQRALFKLHCLGQLLFKK